MRKFIKIRSISLIVCLVLVTFFSVGYSALSSTLHISGSTRYNLKTDVRVNGISLSGATNSGTEQFSPSYTSSKTTTGVNLPNINSTVTYAVTIRNYGTSARVINLSIGSNTNNNMTYQVSNMPTNSVITAGSTVTFNLTIKYNTSTLPATKTDTMTINYTFTEASAMFDTGQVINAKMKKFVSSSATYNTSNTTITSFQRYTSTPNSTYLTDTYKVSVDTFVFPIYMWYDSTNKIVYWYSDANDVYYNYDSSYFYSNLRAITSLPNMNDISSDYVTNMSYMFNYTGYSSSSFTLDLGNNFDTSKVLNMSFMFHYCAYGSDNFTINLGNNFDTSKVTTMQKMFAFVGHDSTVFTLDLGNKFDTSSVTNMNGMFYQLGYGNQSFTDFDLGPNFDTGNVTDMEMMFRDSRYLDTIYVPDTFVTTSVTQSTYMFYSCSKLVGGAGTAINTNYLNAAYAHIDGHVGDPGYFTDRTVTRTIYWGYNSSTTTLYLSGSPLSTGITYTASGTTNGVFKSNTATPWNSYKSAMTKVVIQGAFTPGSLSYFFSGFTKITSITGLNLLDTSKCRSLSEFLRNCSSLTSINLSDLDTSSVRSMYYTFAGCTGATTINVGSFDTTKVTYFSYMFNGCTNLTTIYASSMFNLTSMTADTAMFTNSKKLVGGAGTTYSASYVTSNRAYIDTPSQAGYFTAEYVGIKINGRINGVDVENFGSAGSCTLTVNNVVVETGITGNYTRVMEFGDTYKVTCTAASGYFYGGSYTGSSSGVAYGDNRLRVKFTNQNLNIIDKPIHIGSGQSFDISTFISDYNSLFDSNFFIMGITTARASNNYTNSYASDEICKYYANGNSNLYGPTYNSPILTGHSHAEVQGSNCDPIVVTQANKNVDFYLVYNTDRLTNMGNGTSISYSSVPNCSSLVVGEDIIFATPSGRWQYVQQYISPGGTLTVTAEISFTSSYNTSTCTLTTSKAVTAYLYE